MEKWLNIEKDIKQICKENKVEGIKIPNWDIVDVETGLDWVRKTIYEGYYIKYKYIEISKLIEVKNWEYGEDEPE